MNFPATLFQGRRYAVVGLGRNGLPAARALAAMGAEVTVWDDNEPARLAANLPLHNPAQGYRNLDALILSPGIPHTLPTPHPAAIAAQAAGIPILSDAELLYEAVRATGSEARFIGITGTNGKSTTTALLHHILTEAGIPSAAGGNLGAAALSLPLLGDTGVYVLEMSSYMLERLATLHFDAAVLLNLSPDHLDRHGTMEGYIAAKCHIFDRCDQPILGLDDPETANLVVPGLDPGTHAVQQAQAASPTNRPIITISGHQPATIWSDGTHLRDQTAPLFPMAEARALPGPHNAQNAAAAFALARTLGLPDNTIAAGLATFPGLPHRQERIAIIDGVTWVNDSKATNADATARALACYDRLIWIAGGQSKAGGIAPLHPYFHRIAHALLIGRDAPQFAETLRAANVPHTTPGTLAAAIPAARELAQQLGAPTILLSPACASRDQFDGFEARGDHFRNLVLEHHPTDRDHPSDKDARLTETARAQADPLRSDWARAATQRRSA